MFSFYLFSIIRIKFYASSLKDDTTIIKANAFAGCQDLIGFSEDQWSKIERIEAYAFDGCSKLNSADGTPATSGANLQLREDVQPGQLELYAASIGEYAFRGCESITQLYLNAGVTEIGERAFADCGSLTYVYWRADTTSVGDYLFENCVQIMSVNIGDETLDMNNVPVTTVGNYTFQNCKKLISLNMFSSISHIGNYAFAGCESMTVATEIYSDNSLSEGKIESIGDYAFSGCFRINTIFSGSDMLTHYGEGAFMNCSKVLDDKTKVGLISVALPANLKEVPDYCFMGSECLKTLYETKAHIERIGKAAFSGCTSLTRVYDIEVQNTLTSIDDYAFSAYTYEGRDYEACIELTGLELPRNITSIGTYSFAGNTALKNVDFSRSSKLEQIGESAFEGCVNMKAADLNNTKLTQLNTNVFKNSEKITTVILPATLKSAAAGALDGCDSVSVIMCKSQDMVSLVSGALGSTGKNEELTVFVPAKDDHSLKNEYCGDAVWIAELGGRQEEVIAEIGGDSVVYNGGIYNIDDNGEYVLTSVLTSKTGALELHGNTVSIAKDAFKGCNKITMIIMPEKIEKLSEGIFEDCSNLEVLLMSHKETSEDKTSVSLPEVEGNLFGSAARNENFRVAVEETMVDDYDGWIDAPVMDYGYDYYIDSDVLYGYFLDEMEEDYIELLYVPRSYEGDLDIYIDTIYIADSAAEGCTKLKNVDVSTRTERIGTRAFAKCSSLESVFIANTNNTRLTEIGEEAFMDCVSLVGRSSSYSNRLTIPVSIKKIGRAAFKNCTSLSYFSVQGTLSEIADETFSGCTSLGTFMSTTAGFSAIERIGKKAFYGCTSITSISWTNMTNLSVVDDSAYEGCSNLILATFADKLTRIGSRAFQGTGLVSISLNGATPPELGDEVMDANMQSNIVIYVTGTASEQNYKNAWGSKYPALASRVQGLDCTTFRMVSNVLYMVNPQNARELTAIKVPAVLSSVSFYNASSLYCIGIADEALAGCNQISKITITSNIKTIGNKAFADCTNLSNVVMSNQVLTSIGTEAFKNCTSLTSLDIPSSVTDLGAGMLEGVVNFSELYLTSSIPPSVGTKLFGDTISENIKVYVPEGTVDLYVQRWSLVLDKDYGVGTAERIITTEALETAAVSAEGDLLSQSEDTGTTEETMGSDAPDSSIVTGDSNAETDNNDTGANNSSTEINNGNTEANNDNTETNSGNTETNNSSTGADAKSSAPDNKQ
ncbi:MAG: leucine-rich repeat protein [Lachnospiraceae bacterium]|nr:leucine-rich repeat protein [Lachnospiraceae bacterium]MDD3616962.1 leucine-rich repeat protein [Lachnospiraceae bacterium]